MEMIRNLSNEELSELTLASDERFLQQELTALRRRREPDVAASQDQLAAHVLEDDGPGADAAAVQGVGRLRAEVQLRGVRGIQHRHRRAELGDAAAQLVQVGNERRDEEQRVEDHCACSRFSRALQ